MAPGIPDHPETTRLLKNNGVFSKIRYGLICSLIAFFLLSCNEKDCLYHDYRHVNEKGWNGKDTLVFDIPVTDTLSTLRVEMDIRNTTIYPYKELYIMVETWYGEEAQGPVFSDLICYPLTDREGKWTGTGWGTILQSTKPLRAVYFPNAGHLKYKIYHKMNDSSLIGIKDLGIKITKK